MQDMNELLKRARLHMETAEKLCSDPCRYSLAANVEVRLGAMQLLMAMEQLWRLSATFPASSVPTQDGTAATPSEYSPVSPASSREPSTRLARTTASPSSGTGGQDILESVRANSSSLLSMFTSPTVSGPSTEAGRTGEAVSPKCAHKAMRIEQGLMWVGPKKWAQCLACGLWMWFEVTPAPAVTTTSSTSAKQGSKPSDSALGRESEPSPSSDSLEDGCYHLVQAEALEQWRRGSVGVCVGCGETVKLQWVLAR